MVMVDVMIRFSVQVFMTWLLESESATPQLLETLKSRGKQHLSLYQK
jgi:hypothetical protein